MEAGVSGRSSENSVPILQGATSENSAIHGYRSSDRNPSQAEPISVLFVDAGNICTWAVLFVSKKIVPDNVFQLGRSPMAEAIFSHHVSESGLSEQFRRIESCGINPSPEGSIADSRTRMTLARHSIACDHSARKFQVRYFQEFHFILAMDKGVSSFSNHIVENIDWALTFNYG